MWLCDFDGRYRRLISRCINIRVYTFGAYFRSDLSISRSLLRISLPRYLINGEDRPDVKRYVIIVTLIVIIISVISIVTIIIVSFTIRVKKHLIEQHETLACARARICQYIIYIYIYLYKIRIHTLGKNERGKPSTASLDSNVSHKLYQMSARSWEKRNILDGTTKKHSTKHSCRHKIFVFHSNSNRSQLHSRKLYSSLRIVLETCESSMSRLTIFSSWLHDPFHHDKIDGASQKLLAWPLSSRHIRPSIRYLGQLVNGTPWSRQF